jgi:hypothetical protein
MDSRILSGLLASYGQRGKSDAETGVMRREKALVHCGRENPPGNWFGILVRHSVDAQTHLWQIPTRHDRIRGRSDQMKSRREFLQMGAVALTLPISARAALSPAFSAPAGEPWAEPLYKVVFDERFPSSVAFAKEAKRLGAPVHGIKSDITDLWFNDLYARWKKGPVAIAGLTAHGPIFCLERLAWDQGMRVVFRADHKVLSNGYLEHALSGPESMLRLAADLHTDGPNWGGRMASLATRCPAERSKAMAKTTIVASSAKLAGDDPEHLISWVIVPVKRA